LKKIKDKYYAEFYKSIKQRNSKPFITKLRVNQGKGFINKEDLGIIYYNFY